MKPKFSVSLDTVAAFTVFFCLGHYCQPQRTTCWIPIQTRGTFLPSTWKILLPVKICGPSQQVPMRKLPRLAISISEHKTFPKHVCGFEVNTTQKSSCVL